MEEIGIPELTEDQMATLSVIAEEVVQDYVLSKISKRKILALDITVEALGSKPVLVEVDVDLALSPLMGKETGKKLAYEATEKAFEAVEQYLRELSCRSKT